MNDKDLIAKAATGIMGWELIGKSYFRVIDNRCLKFEVSEKDWVGLWGKHPSTFNEMVRDRLVELGFYIQESYCEYGTEVKVFIRMDDGSLLELEKGSEKGKSINQLRLEAYIEAWEKWSEK